MSWSDKDGMKKARLLRTIEPYVWEETRGETGWQRTIQYVLLDAISFVQPRHNGVGRKRRAVNRLAQDCVVSFSATKLGPPPKMHANYQRSKKDTKRSSPRASKFCSRTPNGFQNGFSRKRKEEQKERKSLRQRYGGQPHSSVPPLSQQQKGGGEKAKMKEAPTCHVSPGRDQKKEVGKASGDPDTDYDWITKF